jgi:four helix bundle protein
MSVMARDYRKLKVFALADELVADVYVATRRFPPEERIGLQAQVRQAAVAVPCSIVIGCERSSESEYVHFSGVALSRASEARYLLGVANRLGYLADDEFRQIEERYGRLAGGLYKLIAAARDGDRPKDGAAPRNGDAPRKPREDADEDVREPRRERRAWDRGDRTARRR